MEFFDALVRYEVALWNAVDRELARRGALRAAPLHAARVLARHGGRARVQDLSREIGITIGAASKATDRLERDGIAVRRPHPDDRRSSHIELTDAGATALREAEQIAGEVVREALAGEDAAALTDTLERLRGRVEGPRGADS